MVLSGKYRDTLVSLQLSQSQYDLLNFNMLPSPVCCRSGHLRIDQGPPTDTTLLDASRRCDGMIGGYGRTWDLWPQLYPQLLTLDIIPSTWSMIGPEDRGVGRTVQKWMMRHCWEHTLGIWELDQGGVF